MMHGKTSAYLFIDMYRGDLEGVSRGGFQRGSLEGVSRGGLLRGLLRGSLEGVSRGGLEGVS